MIPQNRQCKSTAIRRGRNTALDEGEVRIKVEVFGLNRGEVMFREGQYLETPHRPSRLGYEANGSVSLAAIQIAKSQGATVIAVTRKTGKLDFLKKQGATKLSAPHCEITRSWEHPLIHSTHKFYKNEKRNNIFLGLRRRLVLPVVE
ncbi:MAG: hypothetical protein AAFO03_14480 [Bacteroidota bacterium]